MSKFVGSFQDRDDVSDKLKTGLKVDALLITGSKSSSLKACDSMFQNCDKVSKCNVFNMYHMYITFVNTIHEFKFIQHLYGLILDKDLDYSIWRYYRSTWPSTVQSCWQCSAVCKRMRVVNICYTSKCTKHWRETSIKGNICMQTIFYLFCYYNV